MPIFIWIVGGLIAVRAGTYAANDASAALQKLAITGAVAYGGYLFISSTMGKK